MLLSLGILIVGLVLLLQGGKWLVHGIGSIAQRFNLSPLIIGVTLVALGTTSPELLINIIAGNEGHADLMISNVLGSCIVNGLLIIGVSSLSKPLSVHNKMALKDILFGLGSVIILVVLVQDLPLQFTSPTMLSRFDGLIMVVLLIGFLIYTLRYSKEHREHASTLHKHIVTHHLPVKALVLIIVGLAGLIGGGHLVVDSALKIATYWGLSESFVGLTIIAVGTSLPELVTAVISVREHKADIALGNILGANIYNVLFVLGVSILINPIPFAPHHYVNLWGVVIVNILLLGLFLIAKKDRITRRDGAILVALYFGYLFLIVQRG